MLATVEKHSIPKENASSGSGPVVLPSGWKTSAVKRLQLLRPRTDTPSDHPHRPRLPTTLLSSSVWPFLTHPLRFSLDIKTRPPRTPPPRRPHSRQVAQVPSAPVTAILQEHLPTSSCPLPRSGPGALCTVTAITPTCSATSPHAF